MNCNFCGSNKKKIVYTVDGYHIARCKKCSLVYNANPVSTKVMDKLYKTKYFGIKNKDGKVRGFEESNAPQDRLKMLKTIRSSGKLLELGCGTGGFLNLANADFEVFGIDISKAAVEYGRKRCGLNMKTGVLEDNEFSDKYFDVVVMWHLLEHLPKPCNSLREVNRLLKVKGIIGIEVPNFNGFLWRLSKNKWKGGLHPRYHRYQFTVKTLDNILKASGFERVLLTTKWEHYTYKNTGQGVTEKFKNVIRNILNSSKRGPVIRIFAKKISDVDVNK